MPLSRTSSAIITKPGGHTAVQRISLLLLSGLLLAVTPPVVTQAQSVPVTRTSMADPHAAFVTEASQRFSMPEHWIRAVRRVESGGDVRAISSAGAMGLMQVMPATWAELRTRYRLGNDPYDPRDNIMAGTAYLREMHDRYGSPGFLAAYNAGPGRYEEYLAGRPLPAETRAYVATLAPLVGAGEIAPSNPSAVVVAAADPHVWRRAPLFIARSDGPSPAIPVQTDAASDDAPAAAPVRHVSGIVPQSGGLFVAPSGAGGPQ
ncbi:lytic transglycosylase domain-containing protein [Pannonibacter sp.]|uniref:lytic transglycosylase domain-containing protein n=1 Tax=Pannonibacter sp. TaxID=1906786 RepID=UPI003F70052E